MVVSVPGVDRWFSCVRLVGCQRAKRSEFFVDDLLNIHGTVLVMIGLSIWMTTLLLKERDDQGYHLTTNS